MCKLDKITYFHNGTSMNCFNAKLAGRYNILFLLLIVLFNLVVINISYAADVSVINERPKIGLALSGGGARGAAHVGVLKILEKNNIPIDYIAGTSMGAVIGGLYASGMSVDEIEHQLDTIDWENVFNDTPDRPIRTKRRKDDDSAYLTAITVGVTDEGIKLPGAAVHGQRFDQILRALTLPVAEITDFNNLSIPFRAVATDIETGYEVVLDKGDLAVAIRASMTIPAVFSPVELNDQILVDGGSANNLPISVVKAMGADIVIAVDISTPLQQKDELHGALTILTQLSGLLTRRNVVAQLSLLTQDDVLILPELGDIKTLDFHKVKEAIIYGEQAAENKIEKLQALALSDQIYNDYIDRQQENIKQPQQFSIGFIRFENNSILSEEMLRQHFAVDVGSEFRVSEIEAGLERIYTLDVFETVSYRVISEQQQKGIIVTATKRSWGTEKLQTGLELSSDFSSDSSFNLGFAYTKLPFNSLNGEWRTAIQLGNAPTIFSEIYQPLGPSARYFTHISAVWEKNDTPVFDQGLARTEAEYRVERLGLTAALGRNLSEWGDIRFGVKRYTGEAEVLVGTAEFKDFNFNDGYWFTQLRLDTLDNINFPRSGYLGSIQYSSATEKLNADQEYDQLNIEFLTAKSWGNHSLIPSIRLGTTVSGETPIHERYKLGGFMRLSGLRQDQISGQHYSLASMAYQYQLYKRNLFPVYTGAALQLGNTWEDRDDIDTSNMLTSGSLFIGTDTPIGPLYLGHGLTEGGDSATYLFLGYPFL